MDMSLAKWIGLGAGFAAFAAFVFAFGSRKRTGSQDLGVISGQWIAQHRSQPQDPWS
jgi:hypothetical protein